MKRRGMSHHSHRTGKVPVRDRLMVGARGGDQDEAAWLARATPLD